MTTESILILVGFIALFAVVWVMADKQKAGRRELELQSKYLQENVPAVKGFLKATPMENNWAVLRYTISRAGHDAVVATPLKVQVTSIEAMKQLTDGVDVNLHFDPNQPGVFVAAIKGGAYILFGPADVPSTRGKK